MMITSERTWFQNWEDFVELLFSSFSLRTSFFGLFTTILVGSLRPQFRDLARFLDVRRQRFTGLFEGKIYGQNDVCLHAVFDHEICPALSFPLSKFGTVVGGTLRIQHI
jgi:hypothetical protein